MLTRRQRELLNTDFGYEMEKQAHDIVEMEKTAEDCYSYGEELALEKIAEMEETAAEEKKEEEDEDEGEEEKTAAAMGEIITDAYWNTLMEKGAEFYGDPDIYIEKLAKGSAKDAKKLEQLSARLSGVKGKEKALRGKGGDFGLKGLANIKHRAGAAARGFGGSLKGLATGGAGGGRKAALGALAKNPITMGLGAAGALYGAKKLYDKKKKR